LPRPFLRWAGSKQSLLRQIIEALPGTYRTYREPFLGSGAMFFLLKPKHAVLSDRCAPLIETFGAVRDGVDRIWSHLRPLTPDPDLFYQLRAKTSPGRYKRAATFIYLNKTCWNGLYRVNSSGFFNVPYGRPKTETIADLQNLRACSKTLNQKEVALQVADFEDSLTSAKEGDLVFLDPPYVTSHNNNGFVDYNETLFNWSDQIRLAKLAGRLADSGVHVVVTNAYHDEVLDLYSGFVVSPLRRHSTIAAASASRRRTKEALLTSVHLSPEL
jgi:DNA adenine methylase